MFPSREFVMFYTSDISQVLTETVLESGTCLTNVFNKFTGRFVTRYTINNVAGFTGNWVR